MILDEIWERLEPKARQRRVVDVRVGVAYTAVLLDDGGCGLAYTFRHEAYEGSTAVREAGTLAGRCAAELAAWVRAPDAASAAVGLATLNALTEPPPGVAEADVTQVIRVAPGDVVGMVGYFRPLVGYFRQRGAKLHIFERYPLEQPDVHPDWAAALLLPECDVAVISGTAVINRTIDGLLTCLTKAREVVVLGPSTPMMPEIFARRGVTLLSGVRVRDAARVLQIVSEGGGTRRFGPAVQKITLRLQG